MQSAESNGSALQVVASSIDLNDLEMGDQLTSQYDRATGGMREVLRFGCMMLMLEIHLAQRGQGSCVHGGHNSATRGPSAKGDGVKGWLAEYAPTVQRPTAYRFRDVAKAVADQFKLPPKIAKRLTFEQLVTATSDELDLPAQKAQLDLFDFVAGTSQKSWLDQFRQQTARGGRRSRKSRNLSPEDLAREEALVLWQPIHKQAFELLHSKARERLPWLPISAAPEEPSLISLEHELGSLHALVAEALQQKKTLPTP